MRKRRRSTPLAMMRHPGQAKRVQRSERSENITKSKINQFLQKEKRERERERFQELHLKEKISFITSHIVLIFDIFVYKERERVKEFLLNDLGVKTV